MNSHRVVENQQLFFVLQFNIHKICIWGEGGGAFPLEKTAVLLRVNFLGKKIEDFTRFAVLLHIPVLVPKS